MPKIVVGLVKGRHELPVDEYIFEKIEDPSDIESIEKTAMQWVEAHCDIGIASGAGINQCDYTDVQIYTSSVKLVIYVTGLTVALTSALNACALNGVRTVLMHYNSSTGEYVEQEMFWRQEPWIRI